MIDLVFPEKNEKDFIKIAELLGIDLCFVYPSPQKPLKSKKIKTYSAVLCTEKTINKNKNHFTLMHCTDQNSIRAILEQHKPNLLFGMESAKHSDFIHHRASGLNQVHAALAKKNDVIIGFDFNSLLAANPEKRAKIMGRLSQNIRFARKFKFPICIASFAHDPYHLRSPPDLAAFYHELGMHPSESQKALDTLKKHLETDIKR